MNLLLIFNISVWGQKHLWQVGIDPCQHVLLNGLGAGPERGHCLFFIHKLTHVRINSTMKMLFSSIRHLVRHLNTPSLKHSAHKRKNICLSFGTLVCARWKIFHFNWNICTCGRLGTNLRANNFQMFLSQNCPSGQFISHLNPLARPLYISFNATTMIIIPVTRVSNI